VNYVPVACLANNTFENITWPTCNNSKLDHLTTCTIYSICFNTVKIFIFNQGLKGCQQGLAFITLGLLLSHQMCQKGPNVMHELQHSI
jgi:hypothetical protein